MNETITQAQAVQDFNNGRGSIFYHKEGGETAILVNLYGSFGFCYLGKLNRTPKFRGTTATLAVANAIKAGRNVLFTTHRPKIETP